VSRNSIASRRPWPRRIFGARSHRDECAQRFVRRALIVEDATGNGIDLVLRPAQSGRRYFPSRDAGITGLQSVGCASRAIKDDLKLWTMVLGAKVTDRLAR